MTFKRAMLSVFGAAILFGGLGSAQAQDDHHDWHHHHRHCHWHHHHRYCR